MIATLTFPETIQFPGTDPFRAYGTLSWDLIIPQEDELVSRGIEYLSKKGYDAYRLLKGDGIGYDTFDQDEEEIYQDMAQAFPWLIIFIPGIPGKRYIMPYQPDEYSIVVTEPGNPFYYNRCHQTENTEDGITYVTITGPDVFTGQTRSVKVKKAELEQVENGVPIQLAMQSVSVADREFLISGMGKLLSEPEE